jgi:hypothetical protein
MSIGLVRAMGVTLGILLVSGCGEPPPRALFTANYYKTHDSDRATRLKECQSKPDLAKTPDCVNAAQAQSAKDAEEAAQSQTADSSAQPADGSAQPAESPPQPASASAAPAAPAKN